MLSSRPVNVFNENAGLQLRTPGARAKRAVAQSGRSGGLRVKGSATRRALGDISNSQQSHNRLNRPHGGKASLKNLKKTFAPVFAIATVPATPKPRKRADDLLEVECIVPGPSPLSPCFGADEDVERVFSRMRKAKLSQLAAEPAAMPRRLSLEPVDDILKMQDEDSDDGFEVPTMSDLLADPELGALDESIEMHVALGGLLSDDEDDLF